MTAAPIDQWSPLDLKIGADAGGGSLAPTWVPAVDRRRLAAYTVRAAYRSNVAYRFITGTEARTAAARREYGDPATYENRLVAAIRGDAQQITVDGADDDLLAGPDIPERPEAPAVTGDTDIDALAKQVHERQTAAWKVQAQRAVEAWGAAIEAQPAAQARQDALRRWADSVRLHMHLTEAEHDSVGLGDSVVILWPRPNDWPTVQVQDPGAYFPAIPANGDLVEFPGGLHFIWEFEQPDKTGAAQRYLRRLTFELVSITETRATEVDGQARWVGPDGVPLAGGQPLTIGLAETLGADGIIRRKLPWHGPDDDPAEVTCLFSDMTWPAADIGSSVVGTGSGALDERRADVTQRRFDMGVDFLPVIHRPNTLTGREHFGSSLFDLAIRLFDDLVRVDTLVMTAANYLGRPTVGLAGATATDDQMGPGRIFNLGPTGRMDALDLSAGIEQLMALDALLVDRLGFTLGMPGQMTGRGDAGSGDTGIRLLLELAPAIAVVGGFRQVREPKDRLLLKMAQRMAQVAGVLEAGPTPVARISYGNFLPTDLSTTTTAVAELLRSHGISTQTAVSMLVAAGLPVDDAQEEVDRIRAEDTEGAKNVADATGDEGAAYDRLGIPRPEGGTVTRPVIDLP